MKAQITLYGSTRKGESRQKTVKVNCPSFEEKEVGFGDFTRMKSVESQIIDWFDEVDKEGYIDEFDWSKIDTYEVHSYESDKKGLVLLREKTQICLAEFALEVMSASNVEKETMLEVLHFVREMSEVLKGVSNEKALGIVFKTIELSAKVATHSIKGITDTLKGKSTAELESSKQVKLVKFSEG